MAIVRHIAGLFIFCRKEKMSHIDVRTNLYGVQKAFADMNTMYKYLWDSLLDDDYGIDSESYEALRDLGEMICPDFVKDASGMVEATDGRFYIKR